MKKTVQTIIALAIILASALAIASCAVKVPDYKGILEKNGFEITAADAADLDTDSLGGAKPISGFSGEFETDDGYETVYYFNFSSKDDAAKMFNLVLTELKDYASNDGDVSFGNATVGAYQVTAAYDEYLEEYDVSISRETGVLMFVFQDKEKLLAVLKEIGVGNLPDMKKLIQED